MRFCRSGTRCTVIMLHYSCRAHNIIYNSIILWCFQIVNECHYYFLEAGYVTREHKKILRFSIRRVILNFEMLKRIIIQSVILFRTVSLMFRVNDVSVFNTTFQLILCIMRYINYNLLLCRTKYDTTMHTKQSQYQRRKY